MTLSLKKQQVNVNKKKMATKVFLLALALCAFVSVTISAPGGLLHPPPRPHFGAAGPWTPWKPTR